MRLVLSLFILATILLLSPQNASAGLSGVVISEINWMGTEGKSGHLKEWIELYNSQETLVSLSGWIIEAEDGSPSIELTGELGSGRFLLLKRGKDSDYVGALKNSGETLFLKDHTGTIVHSVTWTDASPGDNETKQTMELLLDGSWATSLTAGGTPGSENSAWRAEAPKPEVSEKPRPSTDPSPVPAVALEEDSFAPPPTQEVLPVETPDDQPSKDDPILIASVSNEDINAQPEEDGLITLSEILPNPEGRDSSSEFVELFNGGPYSVSLSGWMLRDASGKQLALSGILDSGSYIAISSNNTPLPSLNNSGDVIELIGPDSVRRDGISYGKAKEGFSLSRDTEGVWRWTTKPTPGSANDIIIKSKMASSASLAVAPEIPGDKPNSPSALGERPASNSNPFASRLSAKSSAAYSSSASADSNSSDDTSLLLGFLFSLFVGVTIFLLRVLLRRKDTPVAFAVEE